MALCVKIFKPVNPVNTGASLSNAAFTVNVYVSVSALNHHAAA